MYIPPYFTATDTAEALRFMQQYSFATVIGVQSHGLPIATHLPVVAERNGEHIALFTHFSRANEQQYTTSTDQMYHFLAKLSVYTADIPFMQDYNLR